MGGRRLVGGIGLEQEEFQRHARHQRAQARGAIVRGRSADAEQEAQLPQLPRLFLAAAVAVHHPAQSADASHGRDHGVDGAARMDDHGQAGVARDLELAREDPRLRLRIQPGHEMIEPAFPDRAGAFGLDPVGQRREVFGPVAREEHGVQSIGGVHAGLAGRERA